jgi:hypothetical protein
MASKKVLARVAIASRSVAVSVYGVALAAEGARTPRAKKKTLRAIITVEG